MKYIKTFEGILDFFNKKSNSPEYHLTIAFVNFLNSINPDLNCFYKKKSNQYFIRTKDNMLIKLEPSFLRTEITLSYRFGDGWDEDFNRYARKEQEKWTGQIVNFLNTFDISVKCSNCTFDNNKLIDYPDFDKNKSNDYDIESGGVSFVVDNSNTQKFINKLTKENYDQFLFETDINKYNL